MVDMSEVSPTGSTPTARTPRSKQRATSGHATGAAGLRRSWHAGLRKCITLLPKPLRFAIYRSLVDCDPAPDARLEIKIAETQEELEASFSLLHDAYVGSGFMEPHPSGLRVTPYHALPTTTTICAKWDGKVVGTISMVREGVFGFPLQQAFDLTKVRAKGGNIAEVSALAVHRDFRNTHGVILFPLLKFMYNYSWLYFDTRHLVIAVHPDRIELYESLMFFERLTARVVDKYDFANGAPAVGATLDLSLVWDQFEAVYGKKPIRKNLFSFFMTSTLPNLRLPERTYFVTNDPVLTPQLLDHFFNRRAAVLENLPLRQQELLHTIYDVPGFREVLPPLPTVQTQHPMRRHHRYSIKLPVQMSFGSGEEPVALTVIEMSLSGCQAECTAILPLDRPVMLDVQLGEGHHSRVRAVAVRRHGVEGAAMYGFRVDDPDEPWQRCVLALEEGVTNKDLLQAA